MEFKQRRIFNTRTFIINEEGVNFSLRKNFNYEQTFLSFEELNFKNSNRIRQFNWTLIILTGIFLFGFLFNLKLVLEGELIKDTFLVPVLGQLSVVGIVLLWLTRTDNIYIPTERGNFLILYANSPSKKKTNEFIKILKSKAKEGVLKKYAEQNRTDMTPLLSFIKERGMIDNEEYKELLEKYKRNENQKIGFNKNN